MILEAREFDTGARVLATDVVILGGGTVGLFLAHLLAKHKVDVLLLEAGPAATAPPVNRVKAAVTGKPHNGVAIGRASGIGGTSALWGGQLVEFEPSDLIRPGYQWPLAYGELRTAYDHTYKALGLTPPATATDFQASLNLNLKPDTDIEQFFTIWLPQPNFALLFKDTVRAENVRIVTGATGYDLVCDDQGVATTLLATDGTGCPLRVKANRFVLAAGALGNAQFIQTAMQHGRKPWAAGSAPGIAFHDHIGCRMADLTITDEHRFRQMFENAVRLGHKVQPKLRPTAALAKDMAVGICGFFSFDSSVSHQLAQLKMVFKKLRSGPSGADVVSAIGNGVSMAGLLAPIVFRYLKDKRIMASYDKGVGFNVQAEQRPIAHSQVRLVEGAFRSGELTPAELEWNVDGCELAELRRFTVAADRFLKAQGVGRLNCKAGLMEDDAALMSALQDSYHMCGGLAMGASPTSSFTDSHGKVWGAANVYVAGPSILPTSSYANSTLTALALTWRLAQKLTEPLCKPEASAA